MMTTRGRYPLTHGTSSEAYAIELQLPFKQYSKETLDWFLGLLCQRFNLPKPNLAIRSLLKSARYTKYGHFKHFYRRTPKVERRLKRSQVESPLHEIVLDKSRGMTLQTLCHEFAHYYHTSVDGRTDHSNIFMRRHFTVLKSLIGPNGIFPNMIALVAEVEREEDLNWFWLHRQPIYRMLMESNPTTEELLEQLRDYEAKIKGF